MKDKKKKVKEPVSMREKLLKRKKELEKKGNSNGIIFPKEGTIRFRIKDPGPDAELAVEVTQFYLGKNLGGVLSPATFGEACPFMEKYQELKASKDDDDLELAKKLTPKKKYLLGVVAYKDEKGKEVDPDRVDKLLMTPKQAYQDIIDLYLDEDEWGDMTSPKNGYDIKLSRTGSGLNDTAYTVSPCQKRPLDKKYAKPMDLEEEVRKHIPSYEELEEKLAEFLHEDFDDDDDEKPKKKKKKKLTEKSKEKKKKKSRDI